MIVVRDFRRKHSETWCYQNYWDKLVDVRFGMPSSGDATQFQFKPILNIQLNSGCQDSIYMQIQADEEEAYLIKSA
jgi:hypothetical protein